MTCKKNGTSGYWDLSPIIGDECKAWSCESPPDIDGATTDDTADTWPLDTTINYDCGNKKIDVDHSRSTFEVMCVYNSGSNSYEWNSTEGYDEIPKCLMSEYVIVEKYDGYII